MTEAPPAAQPAICPNRDWAGASAKTARCGEKTCIGGELPVSHWPPGDSEAARLIRTFRWAGTPLGPIESWPQSLKTAVEFMLSCGFPSFIHWGPEATLLYNDACAGVLGVHHPGALGRPVFEATPVRRACWARVLNRVMAGESVKLSEVSHLVAHGEGVREIWVDGHASPLRDKSGAVAGLWAVFIDITSRIQAEERLRESEKRLHAIMDHAPKFIFIKDRHSRYLFMNEHCARTLNLRRADVIGRNERELVSPKGVAQFRANDEQVWTSGAAQVMEERIPLPDGVRTYLAHKFLLRDASGTPYALCGIATDITERKRNEERLRDSEERLRLAQEAAHAGVFDWNVATNKFTCTPELDDIFGFELGKCEDPREVWSKWVHWEDLPRIEAEIAAWLQSSREAQQSEYRYLRDGELRWISVHARLFRDSTGCPKRMIGTVLDITARKETEDARRQVSEAKLKRLQDLEYHRHRDRQ